MPVMNGNVTSWLMAGMSGWSNCVFVAKGGNDSTGDGTMLAPYLTVQVGLNAATTTRNAVMVGPGNFDEPLVWPTDVSGIQLIGVGNRFETILSDSNEAAQVVDVTPGVQTATFEGTIQNIHIDHDNSGQDGILFDNTGMTKKLNFYLGNFGAEGDAGDKSIVTTQGDTSNAIRIYWDGQNGNIEGDVYLDAGNDGNRFYAAHVHFNGGIETAADAVEFQIQLRYCGVLHEGVTGGNAAQHFTAIGCFSLTGTTYAALDTSDLAGSHTESIVSV